MNRNRMTALKSSVLILVISCLATTPILGPNTILNSATIDMPSQIGVYWDEACTRSIDEISWGELTPGSARKINVYIKNYGELPLLLLLETENWHPIEALQYMRLSWNYPDLSIHPYEKLRVTLELYVSPNIQNIQTFSFNIIISFEERSDVDEPPSQPEPGNIVIPGMPTQSETFTITLTTQKSKVEINETVSVIGRIYPYQSTGSLVLVYNSPDGFNFYKIVKPKSDGTFSDTFQPKEVGEWKISASWTPSTEEKPFSSQTVFTVSNIESEIHVYLSDWIVVPGSKVCISGHIEPPLANSTVFIEYKINGSIWTLAAETVTDDKGKYSILITLPIIAGVCEMRAYWLGNDDHEGDISQSLYLLLIKGQDGLPMPS